MIQPRLRLRSPPRCPCSHHSTSRILSRSTGSGSYNSNTHTHASVVCIPNTFLVSARGSNGRRLRCVRRKAWASHAAPTCCVHSPSFACRRHRPTPTQLECTRLDFSARLPIHSRSMPIHLIRAFFFHLQAFSQNKENFRSHFPSPVRVRVRLLTSISFHTRNVHPHPLRSFATASTSDSGYRACLRLRLRFCPQGQGCNHLPLLLTSQIVNNPPVYRCS
jgi:hypothetical protein